MVVVLAYAGAAAAQARVIMLVARADCERMSCDGCCAARVMVDARAFGDAVRDSGRRIAAAIIVEMFLS
jgi:hypothetical protein